MPYIIIADVKYHKNGSFVRSYINIQDEGIFWDDASMDIWGEYQRAVNFAEDLRNDKMVLSRSYTEVKNIRVGRIQITAEGI